MSEERYRHEFKYLISEGQKELLRLRLKGLMAPDPHAGKSGVYNIRSLYFDDYYNSCYYDNLSGTDPRTKYRIRIYDHSAERITLERKRKERSMTRKTSELITRSDYEQLVRGEIRTDLSALPPLMRDMQLQIRSRRAHPVIIVEYDRIPFVCRSGNVRITLDTNISSARDFARFFDEKLPRRPVLQRGVQLLEVKYDEFLPDPIYRALQLDSLTQTAFSKYALCRRYSL